ncbi:hypothetical protein SLE2022_033860 [Rubroshorea leprosula]
MSAPLNPIALLFISILFTVSIGAAVGVSHGACNDTCGTIPVQFPFGTGFGCGHPFLICKICQMQRGTLEFSTVTGIYTVSSSDYPTRTVIVTDPLMSNCFSMQNSGSFSLDRASPFTLTDDNIFVLPGCSTTSLASFRSEDRIVRRYWVTFSSL